MKVHVLILAGGFGTRLKSVVDDVPKSMALIKGTPFLFYLLEYIHSQQFTDKVVISVGYKAEVIKQLVGNRYRNIQIDYCEESTPLGTGGAIKYCISSFHDFENFLILNGDSFAKIPIHDFIRFHKENHAGVTLASIQLRNFDRYGSIDFNKDGLILKFNEKKAMDRGYINCGAYLMTREFYEKNMLSKLDASFSFEKEILEKQHTIMAFVSDFYFIDIGVPEDYARAQDEFSGFNKG
jgi:D-glycero-alpha-D-manno-heptose 1-phosphate guanylyltransferase